MSHKLTKYNKNNILGWSESDFRDVQCQLINTKIMAEIRTYRRYFAQIGN